MTVDLDAPRGALATTDRADKLRRVRGLLDRRGAQSLTLTSRESLAWLLDGARVSVPLGGPPVLAAVVGPDHVTLHIYENELDRLLAEELGDTDGWEIVPVAWHDPLPSIDPAGTRGAERVLSEPAVAADLRALRATLLPQERDRYRGLGRDAAAATTRVLSAARPEDTEIAIVARLSHELLAVGAEPVVLLAAGKERLGIRHPLPTGARLGARAMVVVGARRAGLIANLTRWIGDEPGASDDAQRLAQVEADAFAATRPGRRLGDALSDIVAAYARHGFGPDEWRRHHQGGPTGYAGRDPRATLAADDLIVDGHAFAWNPTAPRAKIEDTVVVSHERIELLTADAAWPTQQVRGLPRPLSLPYS